MMLKALIAVRIQQKGEGDVQPLGKKHQVDDDAALEQDVGGHDLEKELDPRRERLQVVEQPHQQQDGAGEQDAQQVLVEGEHQADGGDEGEVNDQAAHVGHRLRLPLQLAVGLVQDLVAEGDLLRQGGAVQRQQKREDEREDQNDLIHEP